MSVQSNASAECFCTILWPSKLGTNNHPTFLPTFCFDPLRIFDITDVWHVTAVNTPADTYTHASPHSAAEIVSVRKKLKYSLLQHLFSTLTLLVGQQDERPACKNWVVSYWHGYLSEARCKWFAYDPADATATLSSLAPVKSRMVYFSGAGLPRLSWRKGH